MLTVQDKMVVSMNYTLRLEDGQVVDSSEGREPLEFIQGQGSIIPGLEEKLYGMVLGEEREIVVAPEDAYGEYDPELMETLPRNIFPAEMVLEEGMGFRMRTETGHMVTAYIDHLEGDQVVVDLNHPLAGETLYFHVQVANLREASPEELEGACSGTCASCGSAACSDDCCGEDAYEDEFDEGFEEDENSADSRGLTER